MSERELGQLAYETLCPIVAWADLDQRGKDIYAAVESAIRAYEEREKELVEALEFYADRATYEGTWDAQFRMTIYPINNDVGKRARAILSKHKAPA